MTHIKDLQYRSERLARALRYIAARRGADKGASRRALLYLARQLALSGGRASIGVMVLVPGFAIAAGIFAFAEIFGFTGPHRLLTLVEGGVANGDLANGDLGNGNLGNTGPVRRDLPAIAIISARIGLWLFITFYTFGRLGASARDFARGICDTGRFLNWRADYTARLLLASTVLGVGAFMLTPEIMTGPAAWVIEGGVALMSIGLALAHAYHRASILAAAMPASLLCFLAALDDGAHLWGSALLFCLIASAGLILTWRWLFSYACHLSALAVLKHPAQLSDRNEPPRRETGYNPYQLAR